MRRIRHDGQPGRCSESPRSLSETAENQEGRVLLLGVAEAFARIVDQFDVARIEMRYEALLERSFKVPKRALLGLVFECCSPSLNRDSQSMSTSASSSVSSIRVVASAIALASQ